MPDGFGLAAGRIRAGVTSAIHVHPVVTQFTYVASGRLTVRMRAPGQDAPRQFGVERGEAVRTDAGVPVQFANDTDTDVHVLYVTSPPYVSAGADVSAGAKVSAGADVSAGAGGATAYEDAVVLDDWLPGLSDADRARAAVERAEALGRLGG